MQLQVILTMKNLVLGPFFSPFCDKVLEFLGGFWRLLLNLQKQVNELLVSLSQFMF